MTPETEIRHLVDKVFSLQWCRENLVVPLNTEPTLPPNPQKLIIAIGNFSYLATIGEFIKKRVSDAGYECQFVEKPAHEIQTLLDQASQERLINDESSNLDTFEFSDDAVLDALKGADDGNLGFDFDFDDSEEAIIEEDAIDLSIEMMGTKIQQAAAKDFD